jgi:hypothetical protein
MKKERHNIVGEHLSTKVIAAYTLLYAGKEEGVFCGTGAYRQSTKRYHRRQPASVSSTVILFGLFSGSMD